MTCSCIRAKRCFITGLVCQAALSSRIVVSSCQPGLSRSSCAISFLRKRHITSESVLACVNANHILPSVSNAAMSEILGWTCLSVTVAGA